MAEDSGEFVVGSSGNIRVAPLATPVPVDFDQVTHAFDASFKEIGFATQDGVKFHDGKTVNEIHSWQNYRPTRRNVTGFDTTVSFSLQQWNKDTVPLAFGGGLITQTQVAAVGPPAVEAIFKYAPPAAGTLDERLVTVDWVDGSKKFRLVIPKCMVTSAIDSQISRAKEAELPITLGVTAIDLGAPWYLMTNQNWA